MKTDYKTVDATNLTEKGLELVKEISKLCEAKINRAPIWTQEAIPSTLKITSDQFKQFSKLQAEPAGKPTGKELFKTANGFMLEIKVVDDGR